MEEMIRWRSPRGGPLPPLTLGLMIADPELRAELLRCLEQWPVRVVMETREPNAPPAIVDSDLRRSNPDLVILELAAAGDSPAAPIRLIRNRPEPPAVVTIHATAEPDALLGAIRAGASDCLFRPLEEKALRQIVERVAAGRTRTQPLRPHAKAVGFLSVAGGCGGTLIACHFASELRRLCGQSTLLADFDLTGGMVGFWMRAGNGYSMRDAVRGLGRLDISLWRGLVSTVQPQLDVVSAPAEIITEAECDPEGLLKVFRFARGHYDWVIADLGAGLTPSALRLLGEVDTLFVVSTAEVAALFQARRILVRLVTLGFSQERIRLVLNRLYKQQQIRPGEVERALGWQIETVLPDDLERVEEAQGEGRLLSPKSELGKRISELATRTLGQAPEEKPGFWASVFRASQAR